MPNLHVHAYVSVCTVQGLECRVCRVLVLGFRVYGPSDQGRAPQLRKLWCAFMLAVEACRGGETAQGLSRFRVWNLGLDVHKASLTTF